MAGQSDGSIIIDTSLDNSGFDKGSDELLAAIRSLTAEINHLGKTILSSFSGYNQALQGVSQGTSQVQADAQEASQSITSLGTSAKRSTSSAEKEMDKLDRSLDRLGTTANKALGGDSKAVDRFNAGYQQAQDQVGRLKASLALLGKQKIATDDYQWLNSEIQNVDKTLEKLLDRQAKYEATGVRKSTQGWKSLQYDIDQARANLADLTAEKSRMETDGSAFTLGSSTQAYQDQMRRLSEISARLDEVRSKMGDAFRPPEGEARQTISLTDLMRSKFDAMVDGMKGEAASLAAAGSGAVNTLQHPVQALNQGLGSLAIKAGQAGQTLISMAKHGAISGLRALATGARSASSSLAQMSKSTIAAGIRKLTTSMNQLHRSTAGASGGLRGNLKSLMMYGLGIRSVFALLNRLRSALADGFGVLARYDQSFNQVMSDFVGSLRGLRNAFASAFAPIAEYVLPLLSTLINAISAVISKVGQLIAALTGKKTYMRATKVQYDYAKAHAGTAAGAKDATNAINDEADAAEKAQKTLAGFDDVEILKADDANTGKGKSPSGGGGGAGDGGFEEAPIENSMSGLADMLKDAWKKADFTEIGRMVGEKLKESLENIPWPKIKKTLRKIAKSIATFLNGFLETPGLFKVIGHTIAEGLNSAFEFVDSFVTNFHWSSLGKAIKDGIIGYCTGIDWSLIYRTMRGLGRGIGESLMAGANDPTLWSSMSSTMAKGLNSVVYGASSFLRTVDWASMARSIGTGLNTGISSIDWLAIGTLLCNGFNSIFSFLLTFVSTFDFLALGNRVGQGISIALRNINWAEGGASVAGTISGLFQALNGFIESTDWGALGAAVVNTIGGFLGGFDWGSLSRLLSGCASSLMDALAGALDAIKWEELPDKICQAIGSFLAGFNWQRYCESLGKLLGSAFTALIRIGGTLWNTLLKFGKAVIEGGWQGVIDKMKGIASWIKTNILDPFINGVKSAFGIHSPARVMVPIGQYIVDGMKSGIERRFSVVLNFFRSCGSMISRTFSGMSSWWNSIGSNIVTGIWNGLVGSWNWFCNSVGSLCGSLFNWICSFFDIHSPSKLMERGVGRFLPLGLARGVEDTADAPVKAIGNVAKAMVEEAESASPMVSLGMGITDFTGDLDEVLGAFADKVVSAFATVCDVLQSMVDAGCAAPVMATGAVVPHTVRGNRGGGTSVLSEIVELLTAQKDDRITKEDVERIVNEALDRHPTDLYIGDEQIARHANKGNEKLKRRFDTSD